MIAPCSVGMSIESSPRADYCIKHKDKSLTNERIMLRLTQTPTKKHYLMLEGANGVVYNIQMQGPLLSTAAATTPPSSPSGPTRCPSRRRMATASSPSW